MVNVKFFGAARVKLGSQALQLEAANLTELLEKISAVPPNIPLMDLKNFLIYINGKPIKTLKMFKSPLKDGDEVLFLSPASGG